jgi:hypothetical protein
LINGGFDKGRTDSVPLAIPFTEVRNEVLVVAKDTELGGNYNCQVLATKPKNEKIARCIASYPLPSYEVKHFPFNVFLFTYTPFPKGGPYHPASSGAVFRAARCTVKLGKGCQGKT